MPKKPDAKIRFYFVLAMWAVFGLVLLSVTYVYYSVVLSLQQSEVMGWFRLVGGDLYLLTILMFVVLADFTYLVMLVRWLAYGHKEASSKRAATLP